MADHDAILPPPITRHDDDLAEADLEGALRRKQQGRKNVREGSVFEERVASLFELLGFSTTAGYQLDDLQFDIRMKVKTGPLRSYVLVECKKWARPVGQREVREFISKVEHAKKAERLPYRAIMVSHLGFRDQAHKIAEPDFVELLTLRELMLSLVDLRPNLAAAIAGFEGTELQRLYVEQDVVFQSAIRPGAEVEAAALTPAVCAWLERGGASPQAPMTKPSRSGTPTTDD